MSTKSPSIAAIPALWAPVVAIGLPTGFVLWLYWISAAPGLTWAHDGADGGDLLAAAVVNGAPHPSGYPLYMLLLRGWLGLGHLINPQIDNAYWGNLFSALCVAGAVAFLVATAASLLYPLAQRWLWAMLAGLAFAVTPLVWSQSVITEVYGLHLLLIAAMGWAVLSQQPHNNSAEMEPTLGISGGRMVTMDILTGCLMGLGFAHHLTSLMLWPALLYWRCHYHTLRQWIGVGIRMIGFALVVGLPFYAFLLWRVASSAQPLAVAWGYPRDLPGLWWLISGAAYRTYVFGMTPLDYGGRLAALARLLVEQFTPVGLALVIVGLAVWDRQRPYLRNGALLWILPVSLYAAGYNTADSYVYLLPVVWLLSLILGEGLARSSGWLGRQVERKQEGGGKELSTGGKVIVTSESDSHLAPRWAMGAVALVALIGVVVLLFWRFPQNTLRADHEAQDFLTAAESTLEPGSLVVSSADAPTFALWYGEWGSAVNNDDAKGGGRLAQAVPGLIFVNYALYQFGWYRDLMHDLYPDVPNMGASFDQLIEGNRSIRPIFFTEPLSETSSIKMTPVGMFWRLDKP